MSHVFQLSDEQYARLEAYAAQHEQTPETLFETWVNEVIGDLEEEILDDPLFQLAGIFAIGDPDLADKHDEYLAETYANNQ
jgi:hypothetical protein